MAVAALFVSVMAVAMTPEARRSFEAFERRAESGDAEAQFRLAAILEKGYDTIPADTARSLRLLRSSATRGYAPAQNYLGFLYSRGELLAANRDSAMYWIRRAADGGDAKAAHNLAYMILEGDVSDRLDGSDGSDRAIALAYLERAAEAGLPQSLTMLAEIYEQGRLVEADTLRAVALYEQAIGKGFGDAQVRLLNLMGPEWKYLSSEQSLAEALRYWAMGAYTIATELAAQVGPADVQTARAYALLGHAYSRGMGVPYDHRRANEYFARAALMGNAAARFIIAETLEIFPDALTYLFPSHTLPASMTPAALRAAAAAAGITTAEQAVAAITAPLQ